MTKLLHVTISVSLILGVGIDPAVAQGLPPGTQAPLYGSAWGANKERLKSSAADMQDSGQLRIAREAAPMATDRAVRPSSTHRK
ncbi:hypothetical protein [Rhodopila globiformis]|uniref:hypothetical protein n=1 Tax=Rhodopila globiformis TaxID=1071 RepID=UPI0011B0318A|nr:hypothetical protein [Rhodopila globiformis]